MHSRCLNEFNLFFLSIFNQEMINFIFTNSNEHQIIKFCLDHKVFRSKATQNTTQDQKNCLIILYLAFIQLIQNHGVACFNYHYILNQYIYRRPLSHRSPYYGPMIGMFGNKGVQAICPQGFVVTILVIRAALLYANWDQGLISQCLVLTKLFCAF